MHRRFVEKPSHQFRAHRQPLCRTVQKISRTLPWQIHVNPPNPTFVHALSQHMPDLTSFGEPAILQRLLRHRLYVLSLLTAPSERHVESVAYNHSRCE